MSEYFLSFAVFWGVWLLVPALVDGWTTILGLIGVILFHLRENRKVRPISYFPYVSVIIPVYNGADTLEACILSINEQTYPTDHIEVIVVDNGSTDRTREVFFQAAEKTTIKLSWQSIVGQGKPWALNAGIHMAEGQYIISLDCDVMIAPDTIRLTIEKMESDPKLGAVTGFLEILPPPESATLQQRLLARCEFLEYLTVFGVGRAYQSLMNSVYTLSGAYSVFRRDALLSTLMYNQNTVSEDTDITFQLYERSPKFKIAILQTAKIMLHPIESVAKLYTQRVRWQRGQLEVSSRHERLLKRSASRMRGFAPSRSLIIDHTLSFPRFIWMFFLPILTTFGYVPSMLVTAYIVLYVFYLCIELIYYFAAYLFSDRDTKKRVIAHWYIVPLMPLYRIVVFFFRFSGFLLTLSEPGKWVVPVPTTQTQEGWKDLSQRLRNFIKEHNKTNP
jgi:biofilm PGA synthesis N-glycosyltransferase PgaC